MITLNFKEGHPNSSLQQGDLIYYVPNPTQRKTKVFSSDNSSGVSTYVLVGTVARIITFENSKSWSSDIIGIDGSNSDFFINAYNVDAITTGNDPDTTFSSQYNYTIFVAPLTGAIIEKPEQNDFIFFVKNKEIDSGNLVGYYNNITLENNSKEKAELYSVSCEVVESSK